jgi:gluconate 2-dehydrogenase gamma chain
MTDLGRRSALKLIGGAAAFGITALEADDAAAFAEKAVKAAAKGAPYKPRFFTADEWKTVRILVDLIIPKDERSGSATDAGVPEFMDYLMLDPEDNDRSRENRQTAMRGGLAWINTLCVKRFGKTFADCTEQDHIALLDQIAFVKGDEEDQYDVRGPQDLRVRIQHGPAFFNSFRDLTASGFWSSKMGIEDLGYKGNTFLAEWKGPPPEILARLGLPEDKA